MRTVIINRIKVLSLFLIFGVIAINLPVVAQTPVVTPKNNEYFKEKPRDIIFKIETFGRRLESITANGTEIDFSTKAYPHAQNSWMVTIKSSELSALPNGKQEFSIKTDNGRSAKMHINVMESRVAAPLTIVAPDVNHGNALLICFPTGKTMLIDCAKSNWRDQVVIPLLEKNNIRKLDYFILTHYHGDHDAGDRGQKIKRDFDVEKFYDYQSLKVGNTLNIEGTKIKILNAYTSGNDENSRSLCFQLKFKDFIYEHGGDIYGHNQVEIRNRFPNDVKAHVFFGNHHFHGSIDINYIRSMDPILVLLQAEKAIYERTAYMNDYKQSVEKWLYDNNKRLIETIPAVEIGTAVVRVDSVDKWTYETYREPWAPVIPYLFYDPTGNTYPYKSRSKAKSIAENALSYSYCAGSQKVSVQLHSMHQNSAILYVNNVKGEQLNAIPSGLTSNGITWNLRDRSGKKVPSGIYIFEVRSTCTGNRIGKAFSMTLMPL